MPIVFEEVTGEVDSRRGADATETRGAESTGPSKEEICEMVTGHLHLLNERCRRAFTD